MFILTNHKLFICKKANNNITTSSFELASKYERKEDAELQLRNLPKAYKHLAFVVKKVEEEQEQKNWNEDAYLDETCMDDVLDKIYQIQEFLRKIYSQKEFAEERLREVEREITDIEHAAEFYALNASKGYKLYKMLHERRNLRRKYKDQLIKIEIIMEGNITDIANGITHKRIAGLENRQYRPRILEELFEEKRKGI